MTWLGLEGSTAVITGAGGGIGRAVAVQFAAQGVRTVLLGRTLSSLETTAQEVEMAGGVALPIAADVADPESLVQAAARVGVVDILVNNASYSRAASLEDVTLNDWNDLLAVNLNGYLNCSQVFGKAMLERGKGSIVHVTSISGRHPQANSNAYSVAKAGVLMLSRQLAFEWGPRGVRSNSVSPGMVRTPMTEAYYQVGDVAQRRANAVPVRRVATPDDIAPSVLFLASEQAAYINGADLTVDGGLEQTLMSTIPRPGYDGN
jgi:NAD(P)-dependent dehydrogenase (short-subunit alcohol dehydrogenase family)